MHFTVDVNLHIGLSPEVNAQLYGFQHKLDLIIKGINQMAIDNTKILADLTAQTTVLNGLVVFVQATNATNADQAKQITDLKAALAAAQVSDPAVQAVIDQMDATVLANTALAQGVIPAITTNTPTTPAVAAQVAAAASQPA